MRKIYLYVSLSIFTLSSVLAERVGNIEITTNKEFNFSYKGKDLDQYIIERAKDKEFLLMLNNWPAPIVEANFSELLRNMTESFIKDAKESDEMNLVDEKFKIVDFNGNNFTGKLVVLNLRDKSIVVNFFIKGNGKIWHGIFGGSEKEWTSISESLIKLKWVNK